MALFLIYSKREVWIRRLPALDFIEEAVGRAAGQGALADVLQHVMGAASRAAGCID